MRLKHLSIPLFVSALVLAGCSDDSPPPVETADDSQAEQDADAQDDETDEADKPEELTLVTHDSFSEFGEVLKPAFEDATGITLNIISPGSGGELSTELVLTKEAPLADVAFGVDNSFAGRVVAEDVFLGYETEVEIPQELQLPGQTGLIPIDYSDVCINADVAWFEENNVEVPQSLEDLTKPEYEDLLVVTNATTSSPGFSFVLATIAEFGEDGWQDYWSALEANGLQIADGWSEAYYNEFTYAGGTRPLALSYASSPAYTAEDDGSNPTVALLDTCHRQIEYAGIIAGTEYPEAAAELIDFMLSDEMQEQIPETMYVHPAVDVTLPSEWAEHAPLPEEPVVLDYVEIDENRETWLKEWRELLL